MISSILSVGDLPAPKIKEIYNKETSPLHLPTPWVTVSRCCHSNFARHTNQFFWSTKRNCNKINLRHQIARCILVQLQAVSREAPKAKANRRHR
jgi:hypothetical protein